MRYIISPVSALLFISKVYSHGTIVSPPARAAGNAMKAACSEQVYNNQKADNLGNIQGELQIATSQKDYKPSSCNMFLCKGYQFADNAANVQTFSPGQVIPMTINIGAPHTGTANVSIVDTKANAVIGKQLIYFADYASNAHPIPDDNKRFSVTMPQDLGGKCTQAGDCVLQWFWSAPDIKQTYESCVDFTMGGTGAGPSTPKSPSGPASSAIPTTPSPPASPNTPTLPESPIVPSPPSPPTNPIANVPASSVLPVPSRAAPVGQDGSCDLIPSAAFPATPPIATAVPVNGGDDCSPVNDALARRHPRDVLSRRSIPEYELVE